MAGASMLKKERYRNSYDGNLFETISLEKFGKLLISLNYKILITLMMMQ
jgi:hypothetical protein